jgi:uncharacterized protein YcbX
MPITLSALYRYPVKSCAGLSHEHCAITQGGLALDRHWVIVDQHNTFMTQRTYARMALIQPSLNTEHLTLDAPGMPALAIPWINENPAPAALPVRIWKADTLGFDEGNAAAQWLSKFLDTPCRLLRVHPDANRLASPLHVNAWIAKHSAWAADFPAQHTFAFADGFPLLVINQASLDELNRQLQDKGAAAVPMNRFRPNIVIDGLEPYEEDYLTGMRIGPLTFAFVKPCARCPIPNIDQATAAINDEPGLTLAAHRSFKAGMLFGVNAVVFGPDQAQLHVGDTVEPEFDI